MEDIIASGTRIDSNGCSRIEHKIGGQFRVEDLILVVTEPCAMKPILYPKDNCRGGIVRTDNHVDLRPIALVVVPPIVVGIEVVVLDDSD